MMNRSGGFLWICTFVFCGSIFVQAGDLDGTSAKAVPADFEFEGASGWDIQFRPYLWTVTMKGDVGAGGIVAPVDLGFDDILNNLDFAYAQTLDIRHSGSRFGAYFDFSYLKISPSIESVPAPLFSTIGITLESTLFDAVLTYRLLEWERGWLDLTAGARYTGLDVAMRMAPDSAGIHALSNDLAAAAVDRIGAKLRGTVQQQAAALKGQASQKLQEIQNQIRSGVREKIQEGIEGAIPPQFPDLPDGPLRDKIRDLVAAKVAEKQVEAETAAAAVKGQAQNALAAAKSRALQKAQKVSAKAEKALAKEIEQRLTKRLPSEVGGSKSWWDPHVGIRAKHFLTEKVYVGGLADIGGFGVGSDLTIQAGAGVGYQFNDRFSMEVAYRYLKAEYDKDNFLYDTESTGVFLNGAFYFGDGRRHLRK